LTGFDWVKAKSKERQALVRATREFLAVRITAISNRNIGRFCVRAQKRFIILIFMQPYYKNPPKPKTYGRFFGTIFLRAFQNPQDAAGQQPAKGKNHKNVKKGKIKCFFPRAKLPFS
jgi:hypothetical protein